MILIFTMIQLSFSKNKNWVMLKQNIKYIQFHPKRTMGTTWFHAIQFLCFVILKFHKHNKKEENCLKFILCIVYIQQLNSSFQA